MCDTPINPPDQSSRLNSGKLTVLTDCPTGVDQAGADGDDDEAFVLQLDCPLRRRDQRSRLCHAVCRHIRNGSLPHEPRVSTGRADDDNLLHDPGAKQGQERRDAVNNAERVDLELGRGSRSASDSEYSM